MNTLSTAVLALEQQAMGRLIDRLSSAQRYAAMLPLPQFAVLADWDLGASADTLRKSLIKEAPQISWLPLTHIVGRLAEIEASLDEVLIRYEDAAQVIVAAPGTTNRSPLNHSAGKLLLFASWCRRHGHKLTLPIGSKETGLDAVITDFGWNSQYAFRLAASFNDFERLAELPRSSTL